MNVEAITAGAFEARRMFRSNGADQVVEAVECTTGRRVALKLRAVRDRGQPDVLREADVLRRLDHPGVARLVAHGCAGGFAWIATELVDGETLRVRAEGGWPASPVDDQAPVWMPLFAELCEAVDHIHQRGIAHGDLKPENVVVARDGRPVLVDFGFASRLDDPTGRAVLAERSGCAGTPAYMAPERLAGGAPDVRSDLWSLGAILHELATGRTPSRCAPAADTALPERMRDTLERMLASDPRERFGNALDVVAALGGGGPLRPPQAALCGPGLHGRDDVLDWIANAAARARAGAGTLACFRGPSGVGKTRTLAEAARIAAPRMRVVAMGASPLGGQPADVATGTPGTLQPLLVALGDHRVARTLLAGLPMQSSDAGLRERIARELVDGIGKLAEERPLMILLDDLQWADELTLALLREIPSEWIVARSLLWICAERDDGTGAASRWSRGDVASISLGPLGPAATASLLSEILAQDEMDSELAARIHEAARGNPLHAMELVRLGLDEGWLRRADRSRIELGAQGVPSGAGAPALPLPTSFAELTARRLRVLRGPPRALLEAGAVLGRSFSAPMVCAIAEIGVAQGREALADLAARSVLVAEEDSAVVRFSSDRVAEGIYEGLSPERRARLHASAAAALEAVGGESKLAAVLAHHWSLAGNREREWKARSEAATEALARAAFDEARRHLGRAFELASLLEPREHAPTVLARVGWHIELSRCAHALNDPHVMEHEARAALSELGLALPGEERGWRNLIARRLFARILPVRVESDPDRVERERLCARAADTIVHHFYYRDDLPAMIGSALVAASAAERAGDPTVAARSWMVLASVCGLLRLHAAARGHFARGQAAARLSEDPSEQAYCLATRAVYHANFGDLASAEAAVAEAEHCLAGVNDPFQREIVSTMRGHVAHFRGRHDEARAAFEAVLASARERGNVQREAWGHFSLGRTDLAQGRHQEALFELEAARALLSVAPELQSEVICFGLLACARLRCGDDAGALAAARDAEGCIARSRPSGFAAVAGYAALAETWAALQKRHSTPELARAQRRHLVAFRRFRRLFPMAVPAYELACAEFLAARGARRRARAHLRRAASRAREYGMELEAARAFEALETFDHPECKAGVRRATTLEENR